MKSLTLTPQDLADFAAAMALQLAQFRYQYSLVLPKFTSVTPVAVEAMKASIAKDPKATVNTPGVNVNAAVYFAAQFELMSHGQEADIKALGHGTADAATLLSLFTNLSACGNALRALSLIGNEKGLMLQLHYDEAQSDARTKVASDAANKRREREKAAKAWVVSQWTAKRADYDNNKSAFARDYERLVPQQYTGVKVTQKTIEDVWLP